MIEIGKFNTLRILRSTSVGLYLGDESGEDVLLPNKYCPQEYELDDMLEVFVYLDYAERKVATDIIPKIFLNEFALLEVMDVTEVGAFLDWGLEKHLLVPFREQRMRMSVGRWYVVYMDIDPETQRLYATNKIEKRLSNDELTVSEGEEVELLVYHETDLGFTMIVNNQHRGLAYHNEIFMDLRVGDKLIGYVKSIREANKLDLSVHPLGYKNAKDVNCEILHNALQENGGFLTLTDKSPPDEIQSELGMSKKAFKKAVGALYKEREITLESKGIRLNSQ